MGNCGSSQLEDEEAVAHCRDRSALLADAIRYRFALADAHANYAASLRTVGELLYEFLSGAQSLPPIAAAASPILTLPMQRKGDPLPPPTPSPPPQPSAAAAAVTAGRVSHTRSHSGGSHINFHSSGSDSDNDSPLHSDVSSPLHLHDDDAPVVHSTYANLHFARNQPPPSSVSYEQRPSSETVHFGSVVEPPPSTAYPYLNYGYQYQQPPPGPPASTNFYSSAYPYADYGNGVEGMSVGVGGGYFGASPPMNMPPLAPVASYDSPSTSREPPPPPPPPPNTSTWDFLNFFDSYDSYYAPYTPSRSSKEVREEEGIPDLEDEENEVVKEAYGDPKFVASTSGGGIGDYPSKAALATKEVGISGVDDDRHRKTRSLETGSTSEQEVHVVEKSVVKEEERRSVSGYAPAQSYHNVSEILQGIKIQFDRASESAAGVSKMLEVGKLPYNRHNSAYKVSLWMACGFPTNSKNEDLLFYNEDKAMGCGNLSSTLQKLYMWERKLLEEVKTEEKMRLLYARKREQLRHMSDRGAEAEKLEELENFLRRLSTKIKIAIQVVDTISNNINRLRDEELCLQINELVQGFMKMWRAMSECHHIQLQAVSEAKNLDSMVFHREFTDSHIDVTKKLELELLEWTGNFSAWVAAQRSYVNSLNDWLKKGLNYEPEVTDDGVPPFSPGRLGAPPVFVICNYWSQSIGRISEKDVMDALQSFATNVLHLWKTNAEHHQRLRPNRDTDRALRLLGREEQEIQKKVQAQNKKLVVYSQGSITISEDIMRHSQAAEVGSLQLSLKQIFEAMKDFTVSSTKAYEDLHERAEEEKEKLARENARVP